MTTISLCGACNNLCTKETCNWCKSKTLITIFRPSMLSRIKCGCLTCNAKWRSPNLLWGDLDCPKCKNQSVQIIDEKKKEEHSKLWEISEKIILNRALVKFHDEADQDNINIEFYDILKDKFVLCYNRF